MAELTGNFVAQTGAGAGTSPKGARLANGGLLAHDGSTPLGVRKGVLVDGGGPVVTGAAGMTYAVRAFVAVTMATSTNGPTVVPNDAAVSVATTVAPGSNSRIDVIWVRQKLLTGDGGSETTNLAEIGVTQGVAGASPAVPTIPTGALSLATVNVPAGTVATSGLTFTQTHPWAVANGAPIPVRNDTERAALTAFDGLIVNNLTAKRLQKYDGTAAVWRPLAEGGATAAGDDSWPPITAINTIFSTTVTFPVGRFTTAPAVTPTPTTNVGNATFFYYVSATTASSVTVSCRSSTTLSVVSFNWIAVEKI